MDALKELKRREAIAYPSHMREICDCYNWGDLQEYCESDNISVFFLGTDGYLLCTEDEVVDWVGNGSTVFSAFKTLKKHFKYNEFSVDLRASTSYPIAKMLVKSGRITLYVSDEWYWEDELMYEAKIMVRRL